MPRRVGRTEGLSFLGGMRLAARSAIAEFAAWNATPHSSAARDARPKRHPFLTRTREAGTGRRVSTPLALVSDGTWSGAFSPSRFGSIERLFTAYDFCESNGIGVRGR